MREASAIALGNIAAEAPTVIPELTKLIKDEDKDVRVAAIEALGSYGPDAKAALPELTRLAGADADESMQDSVRSSVRRIQGKPKNP